MTTRKNEDRREIAREIIRWVARLAPAIMVVLAAWHAYHAAPGNNNTSRQVGVSFGTREDAAVRAEMRARSLRGRQS